jgi:hypothetical protein
LAVAAGVAKDNAEGLLPAAMRQAQRHLAVSRRPNRARRSRGSSKVRVLKRRRQMRRLGASASRERTALKRVVVVRPVRRVVLKPVPMHAVEAKGLALPDAGRAAAVSIRTCPTKNVSVAAKSA